MDWIKIYLFSINKEQNNLKRLLNTENKTVGESI